MFFLSIFMANIYYEKNLKKIIIKRSQDEMTLQKAIKRKKIMKKILLYTFRGCFDFVLYIFLSQKGRYWFTERDLT